MIQTYLDAKALDLPAIPDGYRWMVSKASWVDGKIYPLPSTVTVWLVYRDEFSWDAPNAFARPNARSIRRAARKALRRFHRRETQRGRVIKGADRG